MTGETLMLRQIHPHFIQNGKVTSQAFRPTPKDESQLSVDNGDMVQPEASWKRFAAEPENSSSGVMGILHSECSTCNIQIYEDGVPYPEHCYLDFSPFNRNTCDKLGKKLAAFAQTRGWLYEAK